MTLDKDKFLQKVQKLVKKGKSQKNRITIDDINDEFAADDLSPDEFDSVFKFMEESGI